MREREIVWREIEKERDSVGIYEGRADMKKGRKKKEKKRKKKQKQPR